MISLARTPPQVLVVKDPPPAPTEVKKGALPPAAVATDEPLIEATLPLSSLVRSPGGVVDGASMPLDMDSVAAAHPEWQLATALHPAGAGAPFVATHDPHTTQPDPPRL